MTREQIAQILDEVARRRGQSTSIVMHPADFQELMHECHARWEINCALDTSAPSIYGRRIVQSTAIQRGTAVVMNESDPVLVYNPPTKHLLVFCTQALQFLEFCRGHRSDLCHIVNCPEDIAYYFERYASSELELVKLGQWEDHARCNDILAAYEAASRGHSHIRSSPTTVYDPLTRERETIMFHPWLYQNVTSHTNSIINFSGA